MAVINQLVTSKGLDDETRKMVFDTLHEYAARNLTPQILAKLDEENEFPVQIMKDLYDENKVGINLLLMPEKYGGLGGSTYDIYRGCELLSAIDLGLCTSVFVTFLGLDPLLIGGTEEQKDKWIGRFAKEGTLVAYGATEAAAGSDLLHLETKAERVMEGDKIVGYKISGSKQWITNGGVASVYTILARTRKGVSWFLVEKGTEGLVADKHEDKHGIRLSNTTALSLHEVYVPAENLVGLVEGKGLRQAQAVFGYTRLMVASMALGCGWEALRNTIRYSQIRKVHGGLLHTKEGFTHKLMVPYAARLEACRAFIEESAFRLDGGEIGLQTEGAIAKYLTSETANLAADAAIQAHGGNGYSKEFPVEKIKRDVKITCIYEGTSEVLEMTVFRKRWLENLNGDMKVYDRYADEMDALHAKDAGVGAEAAAAGLRALSTVLQACHDSKLTQNQAVMFKLGEIISYAEVMLAFCRAAAKEKYSEAVIFDREGWQTLCRINARYAASWIASEGIRLIGGNADSDAASFVDKLDLKKITQVQKGAAKDRDLAVTKLIAAYPAGEGVGS
jgi:alkylation response protein AidB-like acyl-CoA dehydrogenase